MATFPAWKLAVLYLEILKLERTMTGTSFSRAKIIQPV
jgi:hypothetical protein